MSRRNTTQRRVRARLVRRKEPDVRLAARAIIALAQAQLEADAAATRVIDSSEDGESEETP